MQITQYCTNKQKFNKYNTQLLLEWLENIKININIYIGNEVGLASGPFVLARLYSSLWSAGNYKQAGFKLAFENWRRYLHSNPVQTLL